MSQLDLRVYLVTDSVLIGDRDLVQVVVESVRGGVTCVQLRDKGASDERLTLTAERLRESLLPYGVPLLVNDRPTVASASGAAGVHLGVTDADPRRARDVLGPDAVVGWSVESLEQLDSPAVAVCSYLAVSPIWATPTKTDTARPLGLKGLSAVSERTDLPVVGIGGIDASRVGDVIRAGADGVAVVSAICAAADPQAAAHEIRTFVDAARTERSRLK